MTREADLSHSPDELTQYVGDGLTDRISCKAVGVSLESLPKNEKDALQINHSSQAYTENYVITIKAKIERVHILIFTLPNLITRNNNEGRKETH